MFLKKESEIKRERERERQREREREREREIVAGARTFGNPAIILFILR